MFSKEELYKFEQNLVAELGFVVPKNNIIISNPASDNSTWNFNPITNQITACKPRGYTQEEENAILEFSMAHEICHMIQSFVLKSNLDKEKIQNLSVEEYNKLLCKFFTQKHINTNEQMLNKFKEFIKTCPFMEKDSLAALKFDDFYYVIGNPTLLYDNVYHHNATEIYANHFASSYLYNKYKREGNKSVEFMRGFANKIKERTDCLNNNRANISKQEFDEQIKRAKPKWQRNLIRIVNLFGYMREMSPLYDNHNFVGSVFKLNNIVKQMEAIKNEIPKIYKTEQELAKDRQDMENCKYKIQSLETDIKITFINNFEKGEINKNRCISYQQETYDGLASFAMGSSMHPFAKEVIIDLPNKMVYIFHQERLCEEMLKEANNIFVSENLRNKLEEMSNHVSVGLQFASVR